MRDLQRRVRGGGWRGVCSASHHLPLSPSRLRRDMGENVEGEGGNQGVETTARPGSMQMGFCTPPHPAGETARPSPRDSMPDHHPPLRDGAAALTAILPALLRRAPSPPCLRPASRHREVAL